MNNCLDLFKDVNQYVFKHVVYVSLSSSYTGKYSGQSNVRFDDVIDVVMNNNVLAIVMENEIAYFRIKHLTDWSILRKKTSNLDDV